MKFYSNSKEALKLLPAERLSKKVHFDDKDAIYEASKVLGMVWDAEPDVLRFHAKFKNCEEFFLSLKITKNPVWTKRLILKLSATVYDPLGLISPYTVKARSILQDLWKVENLSWDHKIPDEFAQRWSDWLVELFQLAEMISIPRFLQFKSSRKAQIHVFCDASEKVYACCAYVRITESVTGETAREVNDDDKVVAVSLVTSKARVTPTKTESISRLELAACVIAVRIGNGVAQAYGLNPKDVRYWTDSTNCLFWITSPSSVMKVFVANRVGEVQNESDPQNWRHVPTDLNPADIPTRPPKVEDLKNNLQWWNGPAFLTKPESEWPEKFIPTPDDAAKDEFKKSFMGHNVHIRPKGKKCNRLNANNHSVGTFWDGYKSLMKSTTCFVGLTNKKLDSKARTRRALEFQVRRSQWETESIEELTKALKNKTKVPKMFESLFPFIDERGIIRSESRLVKVDFLPYDTRCPIILTAESNFTKILVASVHRDREHPVSIDAAKAKLKEGFHILGLDNLLSSIRSHCRECRATRAQPYEQRIATLPKYRFEQPLGAFSKVGLDFAGPFELKVGRAIRRKKHYILLFTCLQVRAVHLEVTPAMDTNAVVLAFSRFISIRGMPTEFLSDNWSTFVSKDKELENWVRNLSFEDVITRVSSQVIWRFTPPYGPHHGGVYEVMVKATKRSLDSICRYPDLDFDEFQTFVAATASLLNGRPLTRVNVDTGTQILTPNSFLFGNLGGAVTTDRIDCPVRRWQIVMSTIKKFWKMYLEEYIVELRRARKWKTVKPNVEVGDLVLQVEKDVAPGHWQLAVVKEVNPSADGFVRTVTIKTKAGEYRRPITQLAPMEFNYFKD
jgi:transposase